MKFLHEKKRVGKTDFDFRTPEGRRAYAKDRYEKMRFINRGGTGFVSKSNYELVMGYAPDKLFLDDKKIGRKWIDKFGQYKGTHDRRQVR